MGNRSQRLGWVSLLSALSAWSLMAFGSVSLLAGLVSGALPEILVGLALLAHGGFEAWQRAGLWEAGKGRAGRLLAVNQALLAASVAAYLAWEMATLDPSQLASILARDPARSALELAPPEVVDALVAALPELLMASYGFAGLLVALSCAGMATLYLRCGRLRG